MSTKSQWLLTDTVASCVGMEMYGQLLHQESQQYWVREGSVWERDSSG